MNIKRIPFISELAIKITNEQIWESVKSFVVITWGNIVTFVKIGLSQFSDFFRGKGL